MVQESSAAFEPSRGVDPLDFGGYLRMLWRRKWIILLSGVAVAAVFAIAGALLLHPTYTAETSVSLSPVSVAALADPPGTVRAPERDMETELATVRGDSVASAIDDAIDEDYTLAALAGEGADVIDLTLTSSSLEGAIHARDAAVSAYADLRAANGNEVIQDQLEQANDQLDDLRQERVDVVAPLEEINRQLLAAAENPDAIGALVARQAQVEQEVGPERDAIDSQISELQNRVGQLSGALEQITSGATMTVISQSEPTKTTPDVARQAAIGFVLGLLGAIAVLIFRQVLDSSVRTKADLERASGHRALGLIPRIPGWRNSETPKNASLETPTSPPAEAYRTLRTSLQFLAVDRPIHRLMITSAVASEGKTTTAANLAVTLARTGQQVIVVDADLRRPRLHRFLGGTNDRGFTSVINGASVADVLQPVEGVPTLRLLASGPIPPEPSELLGSPGTVRVMEEVDDLADVVVIDAPPILPVTDGLIVGRMTDGVLVVALAGTTKPREVNRAVELLHQVDAIVLGTVLNGVSRDLGDDYAYDYGYSYNPDGEGSGKRRLRPRRRRRKKPDPSLLFDPDSLVDEAVEQDEEPVEN